MKFTDQKKSLKVDLELALLEAPEQGTETIDLQFGSTTLTVLNTKPVLECVLARLGKLRSPNTNYKTRWLPGKEADSTAPHTKPQPRLAL